MFGNKFWTRLRTGRIIIYSIVTTTIFLMGSAGSSAAVFYSVDPVRSFVGTAVQTPTIEPECSLIVTTTADGPANSGSLRSAIICANTTSGADVINVPAGTYALSISGTNENASATGDLDITESLTLNGAGAATTVINGGQADRVFDVIGAVTVTFNGLTITNGVSVECSPAPGLGACGGGILNQGGTVNVNNSVVSSSSALIGNADGGGIFNGGTTETLNISNSTLIGNSSVYGGAFSGGGTVTVTGSTITGNSALDYGGGFYTGGPTTILNSTFTGNSAGASGSAILSFVSLNIAYTTINGNAGAAAVHNWTGTTAIQTTIIANQQSGTDCAGSIASNSYNLESGTSCGFINPDDLQNTNPLLGPLQDNGGPTFTQALSVGSPAVDTVQIGIHGCGTTIPTDQRGAARPQGPRCDMGAFELNGQVTATPTPTPSPVPTCVPPPPSMLGWWPGDGNTNDIIGGHNGILSGNATYAPGKAGQAFSFDGTNRYVLAPNTTDIDGGSQATYDAWVFPNALPNVEEYFGIVGVGDSTVPTWTTQQCRILYYRKTDSPAGQAKFYADCGLDDNENRIGRYSANDYPINTWHFVSAIFNNGSLDIYVNGQLDNGTLTGTGGSSINANAVNFVWIGAQVRNSDPLETYVHFNGLIDEAEIFNRALTTSELGAIYHAGSAGKCKNGCAEPPAEMIGWWPGDGNANDIIGGNIGTLVGDTTYGLGMVSQGFNMDGSGDFVDLAVPNVNTSPGADITVDFWMYWNGQTAVNGNMPFGFYSYDLWLYQGGFGFNTSISDVWGIPNAGLANRWVHVAGIFHNGNATDSRLFIDGVEQAMSAQHAEPGVGNVTSDARIGGWRFNDDYSFPGIVDEVEIFNRALTPAEVQSIYRAGSFGKCRSCSQAPSGMVSWYKGENNAVDTRSGYNGTLENGTTFAAGKVGQAFSFDGVDDYITIPHNGNQNTGAQITIDAWVKRTTPRLGATIFQKRSSSNIGGYVFEVTGQDQDAMQFVLMIGGVYYFATTPTGTLSTGIWQHVAATYDGAAMKIYVDGTEKVSVPQTGTIDPTTDPVVIGQNVVNAPFAWHGEIDEVQLFNRALSQAEIQTIYNAGSGGNCPTDRAPTLFDYDGDGKTDISIFRPAVGAWYLQRSTDGLFGTLFGYGDDRITPADYNGDGKTDMAVYRPSTGIWYITTALSGRVTYYVFGLADDLPTPADYDGDGKADVSVFRPSTGTWYRQNSSDGSFYGVQFGASEDKPTIGDFDGDGKADIAVFRPSTGAWYRINSGNGSIFGELFGFGSDILTPADYDGDGKTDLAVYRPSTGIWYLKYSSNSSYDYKVFGLADDIPAPGDFDGDGKADINVFRPSDGTWYRQNSLNGAFTAFQFGTNGDKPTMTAFRY